MKSIQKKDSHSSGWKVWLLSDDMWIGSFHYVCMALGDLISSGYGNEAHNPYSLRERLMKEIQLEEGGDDINYINIFH